MNDHDINTLKNLNTPEPSEHARQRALNAALMAFDEAEEKENQKNYKKNSQGNFSPIRLISDFLQMTGEWIMRRSLLAGTAVALVLAVPVALYTFYQNTSLLNSKFTAASKAPSDGAQNNTPQKPTRTDLNKLDQSLSKNNAPAKEKIIGRLQPGSQQPPEAEITQQRPVPKVPPKKIKKKVQTGRKRFIIQSVPNPRLFSEIQLRKASENRRENAGQITGFLTTGQPESISKERPADSRSVVFDDTSVIEQEPTTRDRYPEFKPNPVTPVRDKPVSTFSIDVDTASYAVMRRSLNQGRMPNAASVRVEELINYFTYNYQLPKNAERPFKATTSVFTTPWNKHTKLLHIGIKGHDIVKKNKPRSNLVFLIDVSGSMSSRDKLPLLVSAFKLLVNKLEPQDTISIVTYAGRAGTVLKPTKISEKQKILEALNNLKSGGSTAGAQGIEQAYKLARENFDEEGVNRVILATDGDFNVGMTNHDELKSYIEKQRKSGIFLSVLGFGQGNYNDSLMQTLAQNGNGTAAYIDSLKEAQKVLVDEAGSTLFTIAKDVKIQIEFNPAKVAEYRLIGYETRALKREDFNNDKVDAGDIGSGHAVTAIYEITPVDSPAKSVDDLRYADNKNEQDKKRETAANTNEYAFLKLRYKLPKESKSKLIKIPVTTEQDKTEEALSEDTRFATAVAAFGQKIKGNQHLSDFTYDQIHKLASKARGKDTFGYRSEFLSLIRLAKSLTNRK